MPAPDWLSALLACVFPRRCLCCGRPVPPDCAVCGECVEVLPRVTGGICPKCGRGREFCVCTSRHMEFDRCVSPFYYEGAAKRGVLRMKYGKRPAAAAGFAEFAEQTVRTAYGTAFDLVTAVPFTPAELRSRGFNQSAELGRALARRMNLPYREVLCKPENTRPQHECRAGERWGNVFGSFRVSADVAGRTVLLTDDIVTTGATLSECAKMLKLAGARRVDCVTIACVKKLKNGPPPDSTGFPDILGKKNENELFIF